MIRVVRGVYGFMDKDGIVRPKTAEDGPFELLPDQEARLVRIGIAQYVGEVKGAELDEIEQEEIEVELDTSGLEEASEEEPALSELSVKELREIGKDYGITFKVGTSKADMVKAIEDAEAELNDYAEDDDSEPAPVFDATEAVL